MLQDLEQQNKSSYGDGAFGRKNDANYHIEENGQITVIKKPQVDKFPRTFITPLQFAVGTNTQLLVESDFNKSIKQKRA